MNFVIKIAAIVSIGSALTSPVPLPLIKADPIQQYRSLVDQIPDSVVAIGLERPSLKHEISSSYRYLREVCPAMSRVDIKSPWNLAKWMNEKISIDEWRASPYAFRMNSFRAVSVQKNTDIKLEMLGKLYSVIPSHPAFAVWVDDHMAAFNRQLHADKFLQHEKRNWPDVKRSDDRLKTYISHQGELFLKAFLPDQDITGVRVEIVRDPAGFMGQFEESSRTVRFNFSEIGRFAIKDPHTADRIIAHEFFHLIESFIKDWSIEGLVKDNIAFQDMGEKFFYSGRADLAFVSNVTNADIYENTFKERWAYHVMRAADKPENLYLQTRTQAWLEKNPLPDIKWHSSNDPLPRSCQVN